MQTDIKDLRRRSALTQIELSQKSGVSRSRIQLAEAGLLELRPEEVQAIKNTVRPELARATELLLNEMKDQSGLPDSPCEANSPQSIPNKESFHE
jgi:predicted transcriptional regulator